MAAESGPRFLFRVEERPGEFLVTVEGNIDEESQMEPPDVRGRRVVINPQGVESINSMGVRGWIQMMDRLTAQASEVVVVNLPPVMVTQASMITTFLGRARVESFLSPWYCPSCENTVDQLHGYADELPRNIACPKCRQPMELDWDRDAYLAFRGP